MTIKLTSKVLTLACILFTANSLLAQDSTKSGPLSIAGNVDAYYRYSTNKVAGSTSYSDAANGFGFGMANLQLSKDNGKIGFMADVMFGPRAEGTNYNYVGDNSSSLTFIKQLYVTYKVTDRARFTMGNFMTFVGYELAEASNNLNYSMSHNYTNGPFFHTGLKLDYQFTDKFGGMVGVFNKTDTKLDNGNKFVGGQLSYVDGSFKIYLNGLTGKETDSLITSTLDITMSYQVMPKFGLGLNLLSINSVPTKGEKTSLVGSALYANYAFSDKFTLAARGEYLVDQAYAFTEIENNISAFTLSGNFRIDALTIIPEIRFDSAKKNIFLDSSAKPLGSETSFILAAVYRF